MSANFSQVISSLLITENAHPRAQSEPINSVSYASAINPLVSENQPALPNRSLLNGISSYAPPVPPNECILMNQNLSKLKCLCQFMEHGLPQCTCILIYFIIMCHLLMLVQPEVLRTAWHWHLRPC